jgi:phosphoserine phosphatase RsbU/P
MTGVIDSVMREQLLDRRLKLETAVSSGRDIRELNNLLSEVDAALDRIERGTYGICEVCHDTLDMDRIIANPLATVCIGCYTPQQRRALEDDLQLASRIQHELLPPSHFSVDGWEVSYHYEAASLVSGDYCDLIPRGDDLFFILGDVSGKGVAASMLMAHLHAMFHTLTTLGLPVHELVERASRVFCESTLPTHYATLVCGKANADGLVQICNAGHLPPLLIRNGDVTPIEATGLPLGVFCNEQFSVDTVKLEKGDALLLYTDGLTETIGSDGKEYGRNRLVELVSRCSRMTPKPLITDCINDLLAFQGESPRLDDLTVMAISRVH